MVENSGHECSQCNFVANRESIYIDRQTMAKASFNPLRIGLFTMPHWVGHSLFYLFICRGCRGEVVDYPHGFTSDGLRSGLLYLWCENCHRRLILYDRSIYEAEDMPAPPTLRQIIKYVLRVGFFAKALGWR